MLHAYDLGSTGVAVVEATSVMEGIAALCGRMLVGEGSAAIPRTAIASGDLLVVSALRVRYAVEIIGVEPRLSRDPGLNAKASGLLTTMAIREIARIEASTLSPEGKLAECRALDAVVNAARGTSSSTYERQTREWLDFIAKREKP